MASAKLQNQEGHVYGFSPLPQSETHDDDDDELLSIAVDSRAPEYYSLDDDDHHHTAFEITCERTQEIFGIIVFIALIFLPLYRRLGTPTQDPVPPIFTINSMYLSNFTASNGGVGATWDANFTIINTNVSSIYFRTIDFTLFYKTNPEDVLSSASSYPFYLDKGDDVKLQLKLQRTTTANSNDNNNNNENINLAQEKLAEEIGKDRVKDGYLDFGMQVKVEAIYYGEIWVSDVVMSPHCEDLKIRFLHDKDYSGMLANPNRNCTVPMQWKQMSFFF